MLQNRSRSASPREYCDQHNCLCNGALLKPFPRGRMFFLNTVIEPIDLVVVPKLDVKRPCFQLICSTFLFTLESPANMVFQTYDHGVVVIPMATVTAVRSRIQGVEREVYQKLPVAVEYQ